uniref:Bacterioferritin-associated ferredoxin n=1 Tax=Rhodopseudomonas palustris (strain BisA53) TaxID=316055 RepID=Q07PY6_RHOP5
MIVCSCNVLTDHDVRNAVSTSEDPLTTSEVYGCLGCSRQCGRCARTIKKIMNEALTDACTANCTLDHHHTAHHGHSRHEHHHLSHEHQHPGHEHHHHGHEHHDHHHPGHEHHHNHKPIGEPAPAFALAAAAA